MRKFWISGIVFLLWISWVSLPVFAGNFVDHQDGTILDQQSGLLWQQETDDSSKTWKEAQTYCASLKLAGKDSWRLPTLRELRSLIKEGTWIPAINSTYFPGTQSEPYWSSVTHSSSSDFAWDLDFSNGNAGSHLKSNQLYVRCVL